MTFKADEAAQHEYDRVLSYMVPQPQYASEDVRRQAQQYLKDIMEEIGPAVESYPSWHPLVCNYERCDHPVTTPSYVCGYQGLDHTAFFSNGFITCPYNDGQAVIDSVERLPSSHPAAYITAERLDVKLYNPSTTAILVRCNWNSSRYESLLPDGTIPMAIAAPLFLEHELPLWRSAEVAETWKTMQPYFLGRPHGPRSSLFINERTGQAMKTLWDALIKTGAFGPIYIGADKIKSINQ